MSVLKDASHLSDIQLNSISGTLVLLGEMEYAETVKNIMLGRIYKSIPSSTVNYPIVQPYLQQQPIYNPCDNQVQPNTQRKICSIYDITPQRPDPFEHWHYAQGHWVQDTYNCKDIIKKDILFSIISDNEDEYKFRKNISKWHVTVNDSEKEFDNNDELLKYVHDIINNSYKGMQRCKLYRYANEDIYDMSFIIYNYDIGETEKLRTHVQYSDLAQFESFEFEYYDTNYRYARTKKEDDSWALYVEEYGEEVTAFQFDSTEKMLNNLSRYIKQVGGNLDVIVEKTKDSYEHIILDDIPKSELTNKKNSDKK